MSYQKQYRIVDLKPNPDMSMGVKMDLHFCRGRGSVEVVRERRYEAHHCQNRHRKC